jgi:beta-lactamase class A
VAAVTVPLQATYPASDLRLYLENIAERYDAKLNEAGFDLDTLTFHSGMGGSRLDIDRAMALIDLALYDPQPDHRRIVLPLVDAAAPQRSMDTLRDAIIQLTGKMGFAYDGDQTQASVFIMDLKTGQTVKILADVPYSAESTIKIPIMVNLFRKELLVTQDEAFLLTESILCSNNAASNYLMQVAGDSELGFENQLRDGLNQVSCTAQKLGAEHTFISAPLYVGDTKYQFEAAVCRPATPANTAFNTETDAFSQTTAQDMGVLLSEIYDCANYGSGLMAVYPDDITQTECKQMLNLLSGNRIDRLIELGVPPGTRVAHKNGWGPPGTSGDAAIVFSPGGDYILVVYTHELVNTAEKLPTIASWELIEEISRLTYNYFNPLAPLFQRREPILPYTAIDCVTVSSPDEVDLNDINKNRLDANGNPLPTACYGGAGKCHPFDDWGRSAQ